MADPPADPSNVRITSDSHQQHAEPAAASIHDKATGPNRNPADNPLVRKAIQELEQRRLAAQYRRQNVANEQYQRLWREQILTHHVNHPAAPLWACFVRLERSNNTVDDCSIQALSEYPSSADQLWRSRAYKAAYPRLAKFLKAANPLSEPTDRCEVHFADFLFSAHALCLGEWLSTQDGTPDQNNIPRLRRNPEKLLDHGKLWSYIRSRSRPSDKTIFYTQPGIETVPVEEIIPCRTLRIVDLAPSAALLILASTPRLDLSYVSSFFERYLKFSNWGKVNLIAEAGDSKLKTYFFEYHFSFYHVPDIATSSNTRADDARGVRNVSPFTASSRDGCRSIYEEQLSFLIVGHGGDVYTNIQLAEKYYVRVLEDDDQNMPNLLRPRGEEGDLAQRMPLFMGRGKPSTTFLAWMNSSLLHVIARWQATIEAVESQVHTSFEDTFCGDKHSLLSDDSSFSRSRRYLWAIQVYKIFEQKLEETVAVWREFEQHSLLKLYDPHMPHRDESLETIRRAVSSLENKLALVIRRRQEITNLRDGLFATSQLLDNRLQVLQNDNIRLLTYVNLLFLPLGFCTSIFSMSALLPATVPMHTFVVTLISVTIFTAFLVLNLQLLTELVKRLMGELTIILRRVMQSHWRPSWRKTIVALQNDTDAAKIPIQNRLRRSSHWMYLVFIIEALLVGIPVYELRAAANFWGLGSYWEAKVAAEKARPPILSHGRQVNTFRALASEKSSRQWKLFRHVLLMVPRIILLPLSVALVFLELTCLMVWFSLPVIIRPMSKEKRNSNLWWPSGPWRRTLRALGLSNDRGTPSGPIIFPPKIRRTLDRWISKGRQRSSEVVTQTKAAKKALARKNQRRGTQNDATAELNLGANGEPPMDLELGVETTVKMTC